MFNAFTKRYERLVRRGEPSLYSFIEVTIAAINERISETRINNSKKPALIQKLPNEYKEFESLFDKEKASILLSYRRKLDYYIRIKKDDDRREPELP